MLTENSTQCRTKCAWKTNSAVNSKPWRKPWVLVYVRKSGLTMNQPFPPFCDFKCISFKSENSWSKSNKNSLNTFRREWINNELPISTVLWLKTPFFPIWMPHCVQRTTLFLALQFDQSKQAAVTNSENLEKIEVGVFQQQWTIKVLQKQREPLKDKMPTQHHTACWREWRSFS